MAALLLCLIRFLRLLLSGHQPVALENAAMRLQLAAFQRKPRRPVLTTFDRLFWIALRRLWSGWRGSLCCASTLAVVRWQRDDDLSFEISSFEQCRSLPSHRRLRFDCFS